MCKITNSMSLFRYVLVLLSLVDTTNCTQIKSYFTHFSPEFPEVNCT